MNRHLITSLLFITILLISPMNFTKNSKIIGNASFLNFVDFLQQYLNASSADKPILCDEYIAWQTEHGGFPAIQNDTHVVFILYLREQSLTSCYLAGDFNEWNLSPMIRLEAGVPFFYKQMQFEPTARLDYKFVLNGESWIPDPFNPNTVSGGYGPNSELSMPQFVQPTEIVYRPNIPHGNLMTLTGNFTTPRVQVYLPPNYNSTLSYPTIYTSDGSEYISLGSAVIILDNLIADKRINPVIAVFINPLGDRIVWYRCNSTYLTYLDNLVNYIDTTYSTNQSAFTRLHLGDSMGGLVSTYVGLERPEKFRLIGSHSGAFWMGDIYGIKEKFKNVHNALQYRCWFSAGTYEPSIYTDTQEMVSYCIDHGWSYSVKYLYEGHSWGSWRHTLDDMLEFFFPYRSPPISTTNSTESIQMPSKTIYGPSGVFFTLSLGFGVILVYLSGKQKKKMKKILITNEKI